LKNRYVKALSYLLVIIILPLTSVIAQDEQFLQQWEVSRDSLLTYARMIVDSSNSHVLVTVDETGKPRARTMSPFTPDESWIIWLGTSPTSRKVEQIENNPNVVVFVW